MFLIFDNDFRWKRDLPERRKILDPRVRDRSGNPAEHHAYHTGVCMYETIKMVLSRLERRARPGAWKWKELAGARPGSV
ncbi:hypothetical protein [Leptospira santarosai]|uniref:hypothetical protein n=1 Tax=Leptospira santarosai TaxID=28183 RepID=UPI0018AD23FC|nr:hypothetical protein [Leptospira santarosai]